MISFGLKCAYFLRPMFVLIMILLSHCLSCAFSDDAPGIGQLSADWKDLSGVDGKQHSLADLKDSDVLVVCFTSNSCPYSVDYEDRLIALQQKYTAENLKVRLIAINSNGIPADALDRMKERAREKQFSFDYLKDESQEVAKAFGAVYTPEFYVLNARRELVYRGALDDSTDSQKVTVRYVELAVSAALAGTTPEVTKTGARGCAIRFKRQRN